MAIILEIVLNYGYDLIGIAHHSNEHIDQNNNHNRAVDTEHKQTDKHGKCVLAIQRIEAVFFH